VCLEMLFNLLHNGWIDLNRGTLSVNLDKLKFSRMERIENSIHDLIAALHPSGTSANQPSSSFPVQSVHAPINTDETDEEDDDITRPTAGGTDVSEERIPTDTIDVTVESPAPVEIIRGLASEFLDHQSPKERNKYNAIGTGDDIVSKGIVTESQAQELLDMSLLLNPQLMW
jgi:hypothetical protein